MKPTKPALTLLFGSVVLLASFAGADEITFFGDFDDDFGSTGIGYSSTVPYDPGVVASVFHAGVVGISKFDPTLGTLTDVTIFIDPSSPVFYFLGGGMLVTEIDDSLPGFGGAIDLTGEVMLNYVGTSSFETLIGEAIPLGGSDGAAAGTGSFSTPITMASDGSLTGSISAFGLVELTDFVGLGVVDTLFIDMLVEDTAFFDLENASAVATLDFDVFDSDSGTDDDVIGVKYTFIAAVPEPSSFGLLVALGLIPLGIRRRPRNQN